MQIVNYVIYNIWIPLKTRLKMQEMSFQESSFTDLQIQKRYPDPPLNVSRTKGTPPPPPPHPQQMSSTHGAEIRPWHRG